MKRKLVIHRDVHHDRVDRVGSGAGRRAEDAVQTQAEDKEGHHGRLRFGGTDPPSWRDSLVLSSRNSFSARLMQFSWQGQGRPTGFPVENQCQLILQPTWAGPRKRTGAASLGAGIIVPVLGFSINGNKWCQFSFRWCPMVNSKRGETR